MSLTLICDSIPERLSGSFYFVPLFCFCCKKCFIIIISSSLPEVMFVVWEHHKSMVSFLSLVYYSYYSHEFSCPNFFFRAPWFCTSAFSSLYFLFLRKSSTIWVFLLPKPFNLFYFTFNNVVYKALFCRSSFLYFLESYSVEFLSSPTPLRFYRGL